VSATCCSSSCCSCAAAAPSKGCSANKLLPRALVPAPLTHGPSSTSLRHCPSEAKCLLNQGAMLKIQLNLLLTAVA